MGKKKSSKKKKSKGSKKGSRALPKSLRKGSLPSSVDEVLTAGLGVLRQAQKSGGGFAAFVERGRAVQAGGSDAAREAVLELEGAVDRVVGTVRAAPGAVAGGVQDRVERAVTALLGTLGVPGRDEVAELRAAVETLEARIADARRPGADRDAQNSEPAAERARFEVGSHPDGWAVRREGAERATVVKPTKKAALHHARGLARNHAPSTLTVHNLDGSVSGSTDYGD